MITVQMEKVAETKNCVVYKASQDIPPADRIYIQKRDLQAAYGQYPLRIEVQIMEVKK